MFRGFVATSNRDRARERQVQSSISNHHKPNFRSQKQHLYVVTYTGNLITELLYLRYIHLTYTYNFDEQVVMLIRRRRRRRRRRYWFLWGTLGPREKGKRGKGETFAALFQFTAGWNYVVCAPMGATSPNVLYLTLYHLYLFSISSNLQVEESNEK